MRLLNLLIASAVALALPACNSDASTRTGQLALSGTVDSASFGGSVDAVRALQGGKVVAETTLKSDGSFAMTVPQGNGYHIDFTYSGKSAGLIFPRQAGSVEHLFNVTGDGTFDLGAVRHIGDPSAQNFQFRTATAALESADAEGENVECEDGIDATTGAVCVDDDNEDTQCGNEGDDGESNDDENDGVDCEDGIDSATGAECDGGPSANQDDGEEADSQEKDGETDDDAETDADGPTDAAVADHNLPGSLGCAAEDDEGADD